MNDIKTNIDPFAQLKKNNVSAANQLKETPLVSFLNLNDNGLRVMFIGNSITFHSKLESIGWNIDCGMAASAPEKDYVHLIMSKINATRPDTAYCVCQVAEWERQYKDGENVLNLFENAQKFNSDIIVMRAIENCPAEDFDEELFERQVKTLLDFLNPSGNAKIIITTSFWKHPGDNSLIELANKNNFGLVKLGDLGEDDKMKAIGMFEHSGVANHPGDLGMENIANRIFEKIKDLI